MPARSLSADHSLFNRLDRFLERPAAAPFHSLLYRVGEVGTKRIHTTHLTRGLRQLTQRGSRKPLKAYANLPPRHLRSGLYVNRHLSPAQTAAAAAKALNALRELAIHQAPSVTLGLADLVAHALKGGDTPDWERNERLVTISRDVGLLAVDSVVSVPRPSKPTVHIWVTAEPDWILPHDYRLWRFLSECDRWQGGSVLFARRIAPDTFPVLKALHAQGSQFYRTLAAHRDLERVQALQQALYWFPVVPMTDEALAKSFEHLVNTIDRIGTKPTPGHVSAAVKLGIKMGLSDPASATPDLFHAWAVRCGIDWHSKLLEWWSTCASWSKTALAK